MDLTIFHQQLVNFVVLVLTGFVGFVTKRLGDFLKKKSIVSQLEAHRKLVEIVVKGVEQAYTHLHGKEKLNMAKIEFVKLANSKGIKISENDLDIVIESVVKEMNTDVKKEISSLSPANGESK